MTGALYFLPLYACTCASVRAIARAPGVYLPQELIKSCISTVSGILTTVCIASARVCALARVREEMLITSPLFVDNLLITLSTRPFPAEPFCLWFCRHGVMVKSKSAESDNFRISGCKWARILVSYTATLKSGNSRFRMDFMKGSMKSGQNLWKEAQKQ